MDVHLTSSFNFHTWSILHHETQPQQEDRSGFCKPFMWNPATSLGTSSGIQTDGSWFGVSRECMRSCGDYVLNCLLLTTPQLLGTPLGLVWDTCLRHSSTQVSERASFNFWESTEKWIWKIDVLVNGTCSTITLTKALKLN